MAFDAHSSTHPCRGEDRTLTCLGKNFGLVLRASETDFYGILRSFEGDVRVCREASVASQYLSLLKNVRGSAAVEEYFAQFVENWALSSPDCFLAALMNADEPSKQRAVEMLKEPMFVEHERLHRTLEKRMKGRKQKDWVQRLIR